MSSTPSIAMRRSLTLAMIVRDEETALEKSLQSVRGIADEIVIVDTGSRDKTMHIAEKFGAKVMQAPWTDDFSAARNQAIAAATCDWILWLDAGEELLPESAEKLAAFTRNQHDLGKAYLIFIELPANGPGTSSERVARLRLIPRLQGLIYEGRVRENMHAGLAKLGIQVEMSPWRIMRDSRDHDPEIKKQKATRDLKLIELEQKEKGDRPALHNAAGEAWFSLGKKEEALREFRRVLDIAEPSSTDLLEAYYGLLTTVDPAPENREALLGVCLEALQAFPFDAQLLCVMGGYLQALGRMTLSQRSYEAATRVGQVNPETWHVVDLGEISASCYAATLQLQEQDDLARASLEEALVRHPSSSRLRRQLIDLHIQSNRTREALAQVSGLSLPMAQRDPLRSAIRGACQAAQQNWISAIAYLQTAYCADCRDPICMRWLALALWSTGQYQTSKQILEEWKRLEPGNLEIDNWLVKLFTSEALVQETGDTNAQPGSDVQLRVDPQTEKTPGQPHSPTSPAPQPATFSYPSRLDNS